jgi:hypothetical protein
MLDNPVISLQEISATIRDETLEFDVAVFNPEDRTLYAYATPRRILYDPAAHALTIALHDQHIEPDHPIAPHLPQPRIEPLEEHAVTHVRFTVPRVLRRVRSGTERGGQGPVVEDLPLFEATQVTLEMAHQDVPYYYNPRLDKAAQLKEWGTQIASTTADLTLRSAG